MELRSILVNVDLGNPESTSLAYAIDLARQFGAELIGLAADQPAYIYGGVETGSVAVDIYNAEMAALEHALARAQDVFESQVPAIIKHQWHAYTIPRTQAVLDCASLADIIVTPSAVAGAAGDRQKVALGQLVLSAGRPILDVAHSVSKARFDKIVIGWKDTREARRAVVDALPFIHRAKEVVAVTVSEGDHDQERRNLGNLAAWLKARGITARADLLDDTERVGHLLQIAALEEKADLLVMGAYGHTRMREWLFGGMTRNVLESESLNRLLSN